MLDKSVNSKFAKTFEKVICFSLNKLVHIKIEFTTNKSKSGFEILKELEREK
jgi:hypothetical protein